MNVEHCSETMVCIAKETCNCSTINIKWCKWGSSMGPGLSFSSLGNGHEFSRTDRPGRWGRQ